MISGGRSVGTKKRNRRKEVGERLHSRRFIRRLEALATRCFEAATSHGRRAHLETFREFKREMLNSASFNPFQKQCIIHSNIPIPSWLFGFSGHVRWETGAPARRSLKIDKKKDINYNVYTYLLFVDQSHHYQHWYSTERRGRAGARVNESGNAERSVIRER